jgi:methionine-rich copper-binding protein CopC
VLFIAACGALLSFSEAAAHTDLVSTTPAAGAVLDAAPASVVLTFNEDLLVASAEASILDNSGGLITTVEAAVAGSIVTIPWPAGLDAGAYEVAYRVASGDGHPVTGTVPFSYTGPTNPVSTFAAAPTAALTPAPVPSGAPTPEPTRTAPSLFIIGGLLVAAALVGGIIIVRRGRQ